MVCKNRGTSPYCNRGALPGALKLHAQGAELKPNQISSKPYQLDKALITSPEATQLNKTNLLSWVASGDVIEALQLRLVKLCLGLSWLSWLEQGCNNNNSIKEKCIWKNYCMRCLLHDVLLCTLCYCRPINRPVEHTYRSVDATTMQPR